MSAPNQPNPESVSKDLIMVVEDMLELLAGMQEVLEQAHYEVISVESGKQALDALRACSRIPDLIITDIMMPYMNGIELALEVRKEPAWIRIPIIFMVALDGDNDQLIKMVGVSDYLSKPFDADDLLIMVETMLKRYRDHQ